GVIELVGPQMPARYALYELSGDPHPVTRDPEASFQDVTDAELARDLLHVDRSALVGKRRVAGDDEEAAIARQCGDDVFNNPIDEIVPVSVSAQIEKRQYGNRRLFGGAAGHVGRAAPGIAVILANGSHEAHAPARQGFYQPLLVACISDDSPRRVDAVGQGGL